MAQAVKIHGMPERIGLSDEPTGHARRLERLALGHEGEATMPEHACVLSHGGEGGGLILRARSGAWRR